MKKIIWQPNIKQNAQLAVAVQIQREMLKSVHGVMARYTVHAKCWKENLGCITCSEKMILGYNAFSYELFDSLNGSKNYAILNPYSSEHFTMQIGNTIDNELENNSFWSEIYKFLVNCKYMQAKNIKSPSEHEFDIFSLNIRMVK